MRRRGGEEVGHLGGHQGAECLLVHQVEAALGWHVGPGGGGEAEAECSRRLSIFLLLYSTFASLDILLLRNFINFKSR